ncbi:protein DBF4 homolog A [Hyla sarda]|uniref:protein DBF4 homolog A n=1 Tax=Hyla sarda TaxID=327740 RepID=UPI0024C2356B|nr:protein DBF4 homolog A [Hyla sarda]
MINYFIRLLVRVQAAVWNLRRDVTAPRLLQAEGGRSFGKRREIAGQLKSGSHLETRELAQRPESTGKPESRPAGGQSGRPLPSPSIPKANAVNIGSKMHKGGTQGRGVKMKPGQLPGKNLPDKGPTQKPFVGRVFYLDITSRLVAEKLEKDIKELGGTVEGFLSKEISCLITNKKEAKCTKSLKYPGSMPSPEPAQNSGSSSARPSGHKGDGGSSKKPEKEDASRGKSLLKKVIKEPKILPKNSILANALNWGVRVLHLDEAKIYIDQKKRSLQQVKQSLQPDASTKSVVKRPAARRKVKAQKLKSPFIKVEDSSCLNKTWHGQDEGNVTHNKLKEQKRRGYCECCLQKYDDLDVHLLSQQHKKYAQGPYYQDVDNLITLFDFDFVDWSKFKQETQGSGLFIPAGIVKQEEKDFLLHMNNVYPQSPSISNLASGALQGPETTQPQDAASALVSNLVCHSEPIFTVPCPPQSLCSVTCATDSFSKLPSSRVITPTHENVSPTQLAEPVNISPGHHESTQNDFHLKESDSKRLTDPVDLSEAAQNDRNSVSEPSNCCPNKRLKLDDLLCSTTLETVGVSSAPPMGMYKPERDLENSCLLGHPDTLCHLPHSSPPSKLHRKVKQLERKERKPEGPPCNSLKVSVPLEECVSLSKETLECLFQSSDVQKEFYGFSGNSIDGLRCKEDEEQRPPPHGHVLWSLFSSTGSSASTFNGF